MEEEHKLVKTITFLSPQDIAEIRASAREQGLTPSTKLRQIVRAWVEGRRAAGTSSL